MTAINPDSPFLPDWFFENYEMPGRKMNPIAAGKYKSAVFMTY